MVVLNEREATAGLGGGLRTSLITLALLALGAIAMLKLVFHRLQAARDVMEGLNNRIKVIKRMVMRIGTDVRIARWARLIRRLIRMYDDLMSDEARVIKRLRNDE